MGGVAKINFSGSCILTSFLEHFGGQVRPSWGQVGGKLGPSWDTWGCKVACEGYFKVKLIFYWKSLILVSAISPNRRMMSTWALYYTWLLKWHWIKSIPKVSTYGPSAWWRTSCYLVIRHLKRNGRAGHAHLIMYLRRGYEWVCVQGSRAGA